MIAFPWIITYLTSTDALFGIGKERAVGYSCGCLFVDHASGKLFNFVQYSTMAAETIDSALHLEALARDERLTIKYFHSDNGVFSSNKFKNEDNPLYVTETRGLFQKEFWQAMRVKLDTLTKDFDCWSLVDRTPEMNVFPSPSTWAFKIKGYPDGSVKKFKARF